MQKFSDAHCHDGLDNALLNYQKENDVLSIVNAGSKEEWEAHFLALGENQHLSFGIHPWASATTAFDSVAPLLERAEVIGEIGLDSVWTTVPLETQREAFERQLAYASKHKKPVILHTKGEEALCLEMIKQYPNRYFVHWYSSPNLIDEYLELGCYMSIGVDVVSDEAVRALAVAVADDRLLLESDGLESIAWAWDKEITLGDYADAMTKTAEVIAELRGQTPAQVVSLARKNLERFLA